MRGGPILAILGIAVVNAVGCGGTSHEPVNPEAMLDAAAAHPISSARTEIDLRLHAVGAASLSAPIRVSLDGPYMSGNGARIPSFDWHLSASALGFPIGGRVTSTGTNVYLTIYGDNYEVGTAAVAAANERIGGVVLHPRDWFGRARIAGVGHEGGVDCELIAAPLRGGAMARQLAPLTGELGLSQPPAVHGTARACIGYDDRVLHELEVGALLAIPAADRPRLDGASAIELQLDLVLSDVGQPQRISTPSGQYRPIRDLALTLNDLGVPIP